MNLIMMERRISPLMIDWGFIQIYWYSFFLLVGFAIGGYLALKEAKKYKISEDFVINLFFYTIPIAFVGARLYYVIFNLDSYSVNPIDIFKVWEGGLAIHGGVLAGFLFLCYYTKKHNVPLWKITDILVVSLILGQAIGRWGNFFNGEAHGAETTLIALQNLHLPSFIIDGMYIDGIYYVPTFLYESIWNFIGFIFLYCFRNRKTTKIGQTTSLYLIWYGIGRFVIEGMRTDSLMLGSIRMAQLVSISTILIGIFLLYHQRKANYYKEETNESNL